jgi:hypothetical protein
MTKKKIFIREIEDKTKEKTKKSNSCQSMYFQKNSHSGTHHLKAKFICSILVIESSALTPQVRNFKS